MMYTEQEKQIYNDVCDKYNHNWLDTTISQTMAMEMIRDAIHAVSTIYVVVDEDEMVVESAHWSLDDAKKEVDEWAKSQPRSSFMVAEIEIR